ncbi:MAG TPA: hypothetical protein PKJ41_04400 [Bryobacteraceae bacterium]|nr:hypothetical protein [Bryobacteraceae bacterium]
MLELRQRGRQLTQGKVRVNWRDSSGASFGCVGRVSNASARGFCIDLDRRIITGQTVLIESSDLKAAGLAVVRHCQPKGMGFRVGLQYEGGSRE